MIIKTENFVGSAYIPNLRSVAPLTDTLGNEEELQLYINEYEPRCLILVLGFDLYKELMTNIDEDTGELIEGSEQKWMDLLNGKGRYSGLRFVLANYIHFNFTIDNDITYSGVGGIRQVAKGATNVGLRDKAVKSWNKFYEGTVGDHTQGNIDRIVIGNNYGTIYHGDNNVYQSLFSFLIENKETYPTATLTYIDNINYYGI